MTQRQQWLRSPKQVPLRKAVFQLHLWSGIAFGLYIFVASVTGSILVFSNELFRAATPEPVLVTRLVNRLTDEQLGSLAVRGNPGYRVARITREPDPRQAVTISLNAGTRVRSRLFNPYTGEDLGNSVPHGIRLISQLMELHDDLFAGPTGRQVNGAGALLLILMSLSGIVVWWPGIATWQRHLTVHANTGWRRFNVDLHSMIGFWSLGFLLIFGLSGVYLGNPQPFQDFADLLEPPNAANAGTRIVDQVIYWLAYLHFGRVNGIGIPCTGLGLCDTTTKTVWATFGLAPVALFVTGLLMWWNRVLRRKLKRHTLSRNSG